jgi:hypothetical protein
MKKPLLAALLLCTILAAVPAQMLQTVNAIPGIQPGSILVLSIQGNAAGGSVWGTDVYTSDSSLAAAAVHAGVLPNGAKGTVVVEVLPGMGSYTGSARNGVYSQNWGGYGLGFRFVSSAGQSSSGFSAGGAPASRPLVIYALNDPGVLTRTTIAPGTVLYLNLTGNSSGSVWGSDVYTIDSSPAVAAVHAGLLAPGQRGVIQVTVLPGRSSYAGSSRNGVSTSPYGAYGASYSLASIPPGAQVREMIADPGTVANIQGAAPGASYVVWLTGKSSGGQIWGTDVYTSDSPLARAAVHAGILSDGSSGPVLVRILPGQSSYQGSSRYGVGSTAYGAYGLSYSLEAAK